MVVVFLCFKEDNMNNLVALHDELFNIMMGRPVKGSLNFTQPYREFPYTDIYEEDNKMILEVALAGWKKENIEVILEGNILTIKGKTLIEKEKREARKYGLEGIKKNSFTSTFNVKSEWLGENPKTEFEDGMLRITFTKDETKKIKLI
jgi:HSP20 family protein